jgi:hypothetical protein
LFFNSFRTRRELLQIQTSQEQERKQLARELLEQREREEASARRRIEPDRLEERQRALALSLALEQQVQERKKAALEERKRWAKVDSFQFSSSSSDAVPTKSFQELVKLEALRRFEEELQNTSTLVPSPGKDEDGGHEHELEQQGGGGNEKPLASTSVVEYVY